MIVIKFGLLIGLPIPIVKSEENVGKSKNKGNDTQKDKSTEDHKSKAESAKTWNARKSSGYISSEINIRASETEFEPNYVFKVGKPCAFYHIEYTILPNTKPIAIDVLHWITIAKIYYEQQSVCYKTIIKNKTIWIPVMVEHQYNLTLTDEELVALRNYVVEVLVTSNKKKMSNTAKNEKVKVFYIKEEDVFLDTFVDAYPTDINIFGEESKSKTQSQVLIHSAMSYTTLHQSEEFLNARFSKILKKLERNEDIAYKIYDPPPPDPVSDVEEIIDEDDVNNYTWPKKEKQTSKSSKASKRQSEVSKKPKPKSAKQSGNNDKSKKKTEAKIKISGESYYTDSYQCTYRLIDEVEDIKDIYVVFSVCNLTSTKQLATLCPLVIKLKSIRNLPVDFLIDHHFEAVYLRYNIPEIARLIGRKIILTPELNQKKIKVNESHIHFNVNETELAHFLTVDRFIVELIGIYNEEEDLKPCLFMDNALANLLPANPHDIIHTRPEEIVLAVACFDLSLLTQSVVDLQFNEAFQNPDNIQAQSTKAMHRNVPFHNPLTAAQINSKTIINRWPSMLTDAFLFETETSLKIHVMLAKKIDHVFKWPAERTKFKRFFIIFTDRSVAERFVVAVNEFNKHFVPENILADYYTYLFALEKVDSIDKSHQVITGFQIQNGDSIILYLESNEINICTEWLFDQLIHKHENNCTVLHNSNLLFYYRIYKNFIPFGGIYNIILKYPLETIFNETLVHVSKRIPKPAFNAITKLNNLMEVKRAQVLYQWAMLPTANELMSFQMEFGLYPDTITPL